VLALVAANTGSYAWRKVEIAIGEGYEEKMVDTTPTRRCWVSEQSAPVGRLARNIEDFRWYRAHRP
jgi:hypothetical protein